MNDLLRLTIRFHHTRHRDGSTVIYRWPLHSRVAPRGCLTLATSVPTRPSCRSRLSMYTTAVARPKLCAMVGWLNTRERKNGTRDTSHTKHKQVLIYLVAPQKPYTRLLASSILFHLSRNRQQAGGMRMAPYGTVESVPGLETPQAIGARIGCRKRADRRLAVTHAEDTQSSSNQQVRSGTGCPQ